MLSMAFHSSAVALPKRRQIITIEEGQTGVRATCALVTSEKLDCSGKPNCRFLFALNDDKMWRVRPGGSREGPASCEGGTKPRLETAGTAVQESQSKETEKAPWDQNRRMNKRNFTFKSTTSGGKP